MSSLSKDTPMLLIVYCCAIYMLFKSINITGKMIMQPTFYEAFQEHYGYGFPNLE